MAHKNTRPVFYDPTGRRGKIAKGMVSFLIFIALLFLGIFLLSIFLKPILPLPDILKKTRISHLFHADPAHQEIQREKKKLEQLSATGKVVGGGSGFSQAINLSAYAVEWDDSSRYSLRHNISNLESVILEELSVTDTGITLINPEKFEQTLTSIAKQRETLRLIPLINNYDDQRDLWNSDHLRKLFSTNETRAVLIDALATFVDLHHLDGINIDFENLENDLFPGYLLFLGELSERFHQSHLTVLVNVPFDNGSYDYQHIASLVDTVVVMAYDEHWMNNNPGPIASDGWFRKNLTSIRAKIPKEKLALVLGNYGYDWEKGKNGKAVTFAEVQTIMRESEADMQFDTGSQNPHFSYFDESDREHQVWYLDAITLYNQIMLAEDAGIDNIMLWRLGSEDPSFWKLISGKHLEEDIKPSELEQFSYGYDIDYEGSGEIYRISGIPTEGSRWIDYADDHISDELILKNPTPYQITRYGAGSGKVVSLTFDDGPDPTYTPKILDVLRAKGVLATFFIVGGNGEMNPTLLKRIYNEGHMIGNHTFTHPDISVSSLMRTDLEIDITQRLIESITGHSTILFRPPYGEDIEPETPDQVEPLIRSNTLGYVTVGMKIDPSDWKKPGVDQIVENTLRAAEEGKGNIILLHDGGGNREQTVEALPKLIDALRALGFTFVPLSTLVSLTPDRLMPSVTGLDASLRWSDHFFFSAVFIIGWCIYSIFLFGLIIGLFRFFLVLIFALIHKFRKEKVYDPVFCPSVSVIIPAYNEERVIVKTIMSILKSDYTHLEVIVVDDGSTDQTFLYAEEVSRDHAHIRCFSLANGGKGNAINAAISHTEADIIIIIDADTLFDRETITELVRHFSDPSIGAVAGNVKVGNRNTLLTRLQAIEYITNQNLDRRAYDIMNAITVVPGAVGAWRRSAVLEAGGFSSDTLAEDSDLTFAILRNGYRILHEERAYAYTEAPETMHAFLKQRFRWSFGVLQVLYKHLDIFSDPHVSQGLKWIILPQMIIFQVIFPFFSPIIDLSVIVSLIFAAINYGIYSSTQYLDIIIHILGYGCIFIFLDFLVGCMALWMEEEESWTMIIYLPLQRIVYKWIMYLLHIRVLWSALSGKMSLWNKGERMNSVSEK